MKRVVILSFSLLFFLIGAGLASAQTIVRLGDLPKSEYVVSIYQIVGFQEGFEGYRLTYIDEKNGNVRAVNEEECIGCMTCVEVCPHTPSRTVWDRANEKAMKCDLCSGAKYWSGKGGVDGKQACVESCPVGAIAFSDKVPVQEGDTGYKINLRDEAWGKLGFPTD